MNLNRGGRITDEFARAEARRLALPKGARPVITRPVGSPLRRQRVRISEAMIKRATAAACEEAGWDWPSGPDTDDPSVPSPEECMEPIVRAVFRAAFGGEGGNDA